jgi:transcriptional regulator NrdR family protein
LAFNKDARRRGFQLRREAFKTLEEVDVKEAVLVTKTEPRHSVDTEAQKKLAAEWANAVKSLQVELADLRKLVRAAGLPQ